MSPKYLNYILGDRLETQTIEIKIFKYFKQQLNNKKNNTQSKKVKNH